MPFVQNHKMRRFGGLGILGEMRADAIDFQALWFQNRFQHFFGFRQSIHDENALSVSHLGILPWSIRRV